MKKGGWGVGHHLWGKEKNDRCVKKLAYISVALGGDICCVCVCEHECTQLEESSTEQRLLEERG